MDNKRGMETVRSLLDFRTWKSISTQCILERIEIYLLDNSSRFADMHLLQANDTAILKK